MIDFEKELNAEQLDVVFHGDGPCLVLAGAGSGKTRAITYRVAYLMEKGVNPENILLVTFTNKAAGEMKERVKQITGQTSFLPWSGTFHHISYRILKQYAALLGYGNNFTVLDSDDSESLIKICIKEFRPDDTKRFPSASAVASVISFSRNAERPLTEVVEERYPQWLMFLNELHQIATAYEKRKKESNAMDFDDLLINFSILLNQPGVGEKFSSQFQYILVDEYQDTNKIQASIIRKLSVKHKNLLVVGDDAQSIYSFRAATIENILQFEKDYPGAKIYKIETNYRSSEEILLVANSVIENNREQYKKELKTSRRGEKPGLYPQIDQQSEGQFVAEQIEKLLKEGVPPKEIAVLFRAAYHSQMLEVELVSRGIDYDYRGGTRFFERSHIKDILAYLRILNNLSDTAAWLRVLMHEQGVGPAAAQKVIEAVRVLHKPEEVEPTGKGVLSGKALAGFENFILIWNKLSSSVMAPSELIDALVNSAYKDYLDTEFVDSKERLQDIKQLALFAENYEDLSEFLANTTLQESFALPKPGEKKVEKIVLTTVHQAKGLEWTAVFIINLSNGAFPSERSAREPKGLEEERRLFYVAVTRAKKHLYLTYPMAGGAFGDFLSGPSRFLDEIGTELLDDHSLLSTDVTVLNDDSAGITYVPESRPKKIRPGSFLVDVEDL
ncbi:MAG: UvrD-helicase domain-containing protein [Patescibacteria group bacterium]|jgi:DNA helicase-2/ATP-dependent DNA helicase PcrA